MSSGAETPRKRRGKGRKSSPASGSNPGTVTAAAAGGGDGGGGGGGGVCDGGSFTSPSPSAKKLKIFDYFGAGAPSTPQAPKESARKDAGSEGTGWGGGRKRLGEADELNKTAPSLTAPKPTMADYSPVEKSQTAASPRAPTWGKMVDPRKARRWEMLRCLQEGGGGGGGGPVDPTAWARRSYSLNYAPLFQDARTPGMGSTGVSWGWASHSQVFGGAQAFMAPNSALGSPARKTAAKSSTGSDVQEQELDPGQRRSADEADCASAIREGLSHPEGVESEASRRTDATTVAATAAAAAAGAAGAAKAEGVTAGKTRRQLQQLRNFEVMISWLTSARAPSPAARLGFPPSEAFSIAAVAASTEGVASAKSLLEVALERQDGGPAIAFMALKSLAQQASETEEGTEDNPAGQCRPVALALRFYHAGSTWQRVSRWPTPRRRGQGPGSRLHPDDPALAAAVDEADYSERLRRSSADFSAAVALLNAGLATPLVASAHGAEFFGGGGGDGGGSVCFGRGGGGGGGGGGKYISDPLAALAPPEVLTAVETRSLTKALGIPPTIARESRSGGGGGGTNGAPGPMRGRRETGGRSGSGGGERATVDSKDEACLAFEQWLVRPTDLAKKKARLTRAVRQMADVVAGGGALADRTGRGSSGGSGGGGSGGDDCDGVCIIRLADDAREAIHRVHVAFFAAARHGPHDVPAVLREDLTRVLFGSASRHGGSTGRGGRGGRNGEGEDGKGAVEVARCRHPAAPQILSSVEAFTEYYRLVTLADVMDFAASAGDSGLAYGSLHEASTALLPSGCPLCRCHNQSRCRGDGDGGGDGGGGGAGAVGDDQDVTAGEHPPPPPPPRCCDICELSARVVMRGVGLMERDKDYDNAFHYLEILLQAPSQRLSVLRPRYWQRLVTDLCHKKRFTEALRACEKALAEALPAPVQGKKTGVPAPVDTTRTPSGTKSKGRRGSDGVLTPVALAPVPSAVPVAAAAAAAAASAAAAVFPLGESLPLLRRAVRLAVPPLRWRKRPPPQLRKACLRVMRMDLSWRRAGGGGGSGGSGSVNVSSSVSGSGDGSGSGHGGGKDSGRGRGSGNGNGKRGDRRGEYSSMMMRRDIFGGPAVSSPGSGLRAGQGQGGAGVDAIVIDVEEEGEEEKIDQEQKQKDGRELNERGGEEEEGRGGDQENGGVLKAERDSEDSPKVALGTSLEQAVLDKMLAELGPGWTGLHSENSICLGLFALLCWEALFAPSVPAAAAAASAVAPARPQIDIRPKSDASEESSDTRARRPGGVGPPQQDGGNGATNGCRGEDGRRRASVAVRQVPPPPLVGGGVQGRTVEVCGGSPVADCLEASDAQIRREEEDSAFEHDHPFPSPYQSEPVDLMTVAFAGRRRHLLEGVFASVEQGRGDALVRRTWSRHYGEACTGLNWTLFADGVEGWVTVACAIGPLPLSGICRNLASNYWAWRHGLPDLFLWRKDAANTANSVALNAPAGPTAPAGPAAPADSLPAEGKGGPAGSSPAQEKGGPVGPDTSSRAKGKGGPAGSSPAGLNGGPAGTLPVEGNGGPAPETAMVVVDVDAEPSLPTTAVANIHDIYCRGRGARVTDSGKAAGVYDSGTGAGVHGSGMGAGAGAGAAVAMGGRFCKWVEVKGPGDDLSCAQEAWIDTLVGAGAEAVLLRVEDTATAAAAAANVATASPRR